MRVDFNLLFTKEDFERRKELKLLLEGTDEVSVVENLANWVLASFFHPDPEEVQRPDGGRISAADLLNEPINWASLNAIAERTEPDGDLVVTIEEASSWKLCRYVRQWLIKWGWEDVEVKSEW